MKTGIAIAVLAVLLLACATTAPAPQEPAAPGPQVTGTPAEPTAPSGQVTGSPPNEDETPEQPTAAGVKEFSLVAYNWGWEPAQLTVKKGDTVRITLTSREGTHGLGISEFNMRSGEFGPGDTKTVEFTADKAGTFRYFCNVMCGTGHKGMAGQLVVEE
jgi:cytochrome c oxidase subunit 2